VEGRLFHALVFTIVNRTDSGAHTFAFDNFASAAAGGFVGMAYLPSGFNDVSHAGQRALSELLQTAIANVSREFAPQWAPIARKQASYPENNSSLVGAGASLGMSRSICLPPGKNQADQCRRKRTFRAVV